MRLEKEDEIMVTRARLLRCGISPAAVLAVFCAWLLPAELASANPVPGGTLDPTTIPKYVTPLVIPPVMNNNGTMDNYDIAVRQFEQQILPGGIWNTINDTGVDLPATTVWSYGPDADSADIVAPDPTSQFNYPAYTIDTLSDVPVSIRWINDLVDADGNYLPHLLAVDQTLHWANPEMDCRMGDPRTDCSGDNPEPYTGPVPIVTHVHGASCGSPQRWLPGAVVAAGRKMTFLTASPRAAPSSTTPQEPTTAPSATPITSTARTNPPPRSGTTTTAWV